MTESPTVSVVIATYNREATLGRAIGSVLRQGYPAFELIVVDDGSMDGTERLVRAYEDPRIRYVRQSNRGRCAARNAGADVARGEVLTFLDSDDEVGQDWLQTFVDAFDSETVAVACSGLRMVDSDSQATVEERLPRKLGDVYHGYTGLFLTGTFALRKALFQQVGGYDERMSYSENTDLAHRIVDTVAGSDMRIVGAMVYNLKYYVSKTRNSTREDYENLLQGALVILEKHGPKYERLHPGGAANFHAIAGVNALRLGHARDARRYLREAIRLKPQSPKNYARYALAFVPRPFRTVALGS